MNRLDRVWARQQVALVYGSVVLDEALNLLFVIVLQYSGLIGLQ